MYRDALSGLVCVFFLFLQHICLVPSLVNALFLSLALPCLTMFRHVLGGANIFFYSLSLPLLCVLSLHNLPCIWVLMPSICPSLFLSSSICVSFCFTSCSTLSFVHFYVDTFHSVTNWTPFIFTCCIPESVWSVVEFCFRLLAFCLTLIQAMKIMLQRNMMTHTHTYTETKTSHTIEMLLINYTTRW